MVNEIKLSNGKRYYSVYYKGINKLLLYTKSIREVESYTGKKYGYW